MTQPVWDSKVTGLGSRSCESFKVRKLKQIKGPSLNLGLTLFFNPKSVANVDLMPQRVSRNTSEKKSKVVRYSVVRLSLRWRLESVSKERQSQPGYHAQ